MLECCIKLNMQYTVLLLVSAHGLANICELKELPLPTAPHAEDIRRVSDAILQTDVSLTREYSNTELGRCKRRARLDSAFPQHASFQTHRLTVSNLRVFRGRTFEWVLLGTRSF
ncbi:hypothetical protein B0H13DRAFT_2110146 [Mycena leptocephala]|nr:hypothetical protein B0H13DRAFT_2110146 [Mycena leptocephala]